jgi:hypothetical protein
VVVEARLRRRCAACGVEDTHTHHIQYGMFAPGGEDPMAASRHTQCCAADGCPVCQTFLEFAREALGDVAPSDRFTAWMISPPRPVLQALFERYGIESPDFRIG